MAPPNFDRQRELYLDGFAGIKPRVPAAFGPLEEAARRKLSPRAFAYIAGGAGSETTMRANRQAFEARPIVPRFLRDVSRRDPSVELFGHKLPFPLVLSPIGVLELAHRQADLAVGRAAASLGVPFLFSNQASVPMENVAAAMGDAPHWFQLYWSKNFDLVKSFVARAERSGCSALVVTLDTGVLGWRPRDLDLTHLPFLGAKGLAQYTSDPVFQELVSQAVAGPRSRVTLSAVLGLFDLVGRYPGPGFFRKLLSGRPLKAVQTFLAIYSNPALQWSDLPSLRAITKLPIVLKGILHGDDARRALDHGVDGILVSNHGGRQVDGAIASLDALPAVVDAVRGRVPVLLDSGVRSGADVFKALATGATAVGLGRPYAYGLAVAGEAGVRDVVKNVLAEFDLTMALAGCATVADIRGRPSPMGFGT